MHVTSWTENKGALAKEGTSKEYTGIEGSSGATVEELYTRTENNLQRIEQRFMPSSNSYAEDLLAV